MTDTADIIQKLNAAAQQLTGAEAPFEIELRQVNGVELRTYKTAPLRSGMRWHRGAHTPTRLS